MSPRTVVIVMVSLLKKLVKDFFVSAVGTWSHWPFIKHIRVIQHEKEPTWANIGIMIQRKHISNVSVCRYIFDQFYKAQDSRSLNLKQIIIFFSSSMYGFFFDNMVLPGWFLSSSIPSMAMKKWGWPDFRSHMWWWHDPIFGWFPTFSLRRVFDFPRSSTFDLQNWTWQLWPWQLWLFVPCHGVKAELSIFMGRT